MDDRIPEEGVEDETIGEGDAGDTAGWADTDSGDVDYALDDPIAEKEFADDLVTNDAVAGETVWSGAGDGNDGPTGGSPREAEPVYDEHDPQGDLDDGVLTEEDVEDEGI
ncbi:hypothetical protein P5G50_15995 [Leifsonia sp. F6_8S_P_1B]|uniref:DUF5709 domain-containing protein n=1 Tax=Leifsonia williamsii TaxID=3035919 RepID=A0ABT8KER7_9MICO|nr:hypothetical protein [Leifsonia williamsii]MDN4615953.1 hypothetical protein [Leifsonia williamsii]